MVLVRDKLKELRRMSGLSQAELARTLGIPQTTYANYETGRGTPPLTMLKRLADFYGVTADSILGEIGEEEQRIAAQVQALPPTEREAIKTILNVLTERTNGKGGGDNLAFCLPSFRGFVRWQGDVTEKEQYTAQAANG